MADGRFILVAEDDVELGGNLMEILRNAGYEVELARNGEIALDILRARQRSCLLLLDLSMPVMSGFDVLDRLRSDRSLPEVNVLVMTAGTTKSGEIGGAPILQKPFPPEVLLAAAARYSLG